MVEVADEAAYVPHHKKKLAFIFSAMRHFAQEVRAAGFTVDYVPLDDPDNTGDFTGELTRAVKRHNPSEIVMTAPSEYRVLEMARGWAGSLRLPVRILEDDRFIASHDTFTQWAQGRKQFRMEYFYRDMRRKTGLLMEGKNPIGDKWNYDAENRKPAKSGLNLPKRLSFPPDDITANVLALVEQRFPDNFGDLHPFNWGVTRTDAEAALEHFINDCLPNFGDYQDAMLKGRPFMYHALIALYINVGLLNPLATCQKVEAAYHNGHAPINAVEGFIRQIIGWREYVRGIYWLKMPEYITANALGATRDLPAFYWTGETDMACMRDAITQTKQNAYAHHIQRLMVTGNFALLIGVDPHQVHEWYLAVYADAFEWVEAPNTIGMALFADGGLLGSKPYAASGNYINKMSDYCKGCRYKVKEKTGPDACPFNPLYWDFVVRNRDKLGANPRMGQIYRTWDKIDADKQAAYLASAKAVLQDLP